jgi:hypothetical protein
LLLEASEAAVLGEATIPLLSTGTTGNCGGGGLGEENAPANKREEIQEDSPAVAAGAINSLCCPFLGSKGLIITTDASDCCEDRLPRLSRTMAPSLTPLLRFFFPSPTDEALMAPSDAAAEAAEAFLFAFTT